MKVTKSTFSMRFTFIVHINKNKIPGLKLLFIALLGALINDQPDEIFLKEYYKEFPDEQ